MDESQDYRTDKMDSLEGRNVAVSRWQRFLQRDLADVVDSLDFGQLPRHPNMTLEELDADVRDEIAGWAKERSELMGFWISWHLAGGFRQLEAGGWDRSTIFRKVRRFRNAFGRHPDEATFPWLRLDLRKAWAAQVEQSLTQAAGSDPD